MSKKSSRDRRSHDLRVRLTEQEKNDLVQLAGDWGLTISAFVRQMSKFRVHAQAYLALGRVNSQIEKILAELLNGRARAMIERSNESKKQFYHLQSQLTEVSRQIQSIREQLRQ